MFDSMMSTTDEVRAFARQRGIVRARDVEERGLSARYLRRLHERGELERVGRGLYRHPEAPVTEHHSLALVAARYPEAVICLCSALQFHELTTQWPRRVWIARGASDWSPEASPVKLELVRMSGDALTEGVQTTEIEGVSVRVFAPAKTVADCFKFRRKVGLSVALDALRDYLRTDAGSIDSLFHYADVCRVRTVMRPYIEAFVAS